ncbi:TetR/AcrR family transcriptional regulator [Paenarthrobacter aurescens]|uniref:TetR/AcrR family transcriptional regulator n=1 Tax=Paenarthrobacter aurescens TaxID=43663 RepID=UPI0035EC286D
MTTPRKAMAAPKSGNGGSVGRPRDGSIRRKVIHAAIDCYAERGWSGFSFESVSSRAAVARNALYLRWSGREELLIDAFRELTPAIAPPDRGNIRDDLTDLALAYHQVMSGAPGRAGMRLFIEQEAVAEVFQAVSAEISANRELLILETLRRAQSRGEVRSEADLNVVTELLVGALMLDALGHDKTSHQVRGTVAKTVETLLTGLGAQPSMGGGESQR